MAKSNDLTVVVDSDALVAQVNIEDTHHKITNKISRFLIENEATVIYPVTAIIESNAVIQRVLGSTATAYGTAVIFSNPSINVAEVSQDTLRQALEFFSSKTSKKNTLFDCIVAAVAKEHFATAVFSFDKFYKKKGLKLAYELL